MNIIELLQSRVAYDPETGALTWKHRAPETFRDGRYSRERQAAIFNGAHAGKLAFNCPNGAGYLMGTFEGAPIKAHHAAWMIYYGENPPPQIDHDDGDGSNNRIANLNASGPSDNAKNRKTPRNNTSGRIGVYPKGGRWGAKIGTVHLGTFETLEEAAAARAAAEKMKQYHPNHGRQKHGN
jgi:hypothetical protein